ncbi:MAG: ABC transporter substrate-binding protein [Firmicutes bacterium]|nr:ABC transporter substrate-binding protein [Bacillota bacterium]
MKKFLAVLLAMAMVVSCLAGCQGGGEESSKTETSKTETSKTETSKAEESSKTEEEKPYELLDAIEYTGEMNIARSSYVAYPVESDGYTLRWWVALPNNVANGVGTVADTEWAKNMQEYTGVGIEWIESDGSSEAFGVMSVSAELPDVVEWEWANAYPGGPVAAEADGLLTYLNDLIQPYTNGADLWQFLQDNPQIDKQVKDDSGNYYCVPFIRGSKYLQCTSGPIVRADLFEAAGVDYTTISTVDEMYDALTKVKAVEGIEYPMLGRSLGEVINLLGSAYNFRAGMYRDYDTTEIKYGYAEEGFKEFMKTAVQWKNEGLLHPDSLSIDKNTRTEAMLNGKTAFIYGAGGGDLGTYVQAVETDPSKYVSTIKFDTINFLVANEGDTPHYAGASYDYATTSKSHGAITADCEHPELAMAVLNWGFSEEGHLILNFGSDYTYDENGDPTYSEKTMNYAENGFASIATSMAAGGRANMSFPGAQDPGYIFAYYASPVQKQALYNWNDYQDSQSTLIPPVTLTAEEATEYATIINNLDTQVKTSYGAWFAGTADVEADWDSYLATLESMGLSRAIELQQAAVDRYDAR